jgi:hypothetical protein
MPTVKDKEQERLAKEAQAEQDKLASEKFLEMVKSGDAGQMKAASDLGTDMIRERFREKSFAKAMFTWTTTTNDDLVPQLESEENMRYFNYEVDSPASMQIGLYGNPNNYVFGGRRGAMKFFRVITPRMYKDVNEMRTYDYDIRRVIADNIVRDMSLEFDGALLTGIFFAVGGAPGTISEWSSAPQWVQHGGSYGRETVTRLKEQMIRVNLDRGLTVKHALCNTVTALQPALFGRDEAGGDMAQDLLKDGVTFDDWGGLTWTVSIKRNMIEDGTIYTFTDEDHFIRCSILQETTMHIDSKLDIIEFVAMDNSGMLLANMRGAGRTDLLGVAA